MENKEKQIVDLMKDKEFVKLVKLIENTHPFYVETIALRVYEKYQQKLPKDSVVLSKEEYALYDVVKKDYPNDMTCLVEKLTEISHNSYKKGIKETAEKILNELFDIFDNKIKELLKLKKSNNNEYNDGRLCECCSCIDEIRDFATREGVEIKE